MVGELSKMELFKSEEEQEQIKLFKKKCNFLSNSGKCYITSSFDDTSKCSFENCIFMKILESTQR